MSLHKKSSVRLLSSDWRRWKWCTDLMSLQIRPSVLNIYYCPPSPIIISERKCVRSEFVSSDGCNKLKWDFIPDKWFGILMRAERPRLPRPYPPVRSRWLINVAEGCKRWLKKKWMFSSTDSRWEMSVNVPERWPRSRYLIHGQASSPGFRFRRAWCLRQCPKSHAHWSSGRTKMFPKTVLKFPFFPVEGLGFFQMDQITIQE